jgi:hypothetical protein
MRGLALGTSAGIGVGVITITFQRIALSILGGANEVTPRHVGTKLTVAAARHNGIASL